MIHAVSALANGISPLRLIVSTNQKRGKDSFPQKFSRHDSTPLTAELNLTSQDLETPTRRWRIPPFAIHCQRSRV
jgi:hypothetical protein